MTQPGRPAVLFSGATGQIGRGVVDLLLDADVPVRALTRSADASTLPANVDVVTGDLTVPESLDEALDGVDAAAYGAAETAVVDERDVAAVAALALWRDGHAGGDYVLTGPEPLSQAEQVGIIGEVLHRQIPFEELSPEEFRRVTQASWPAPVVDMLLTAWSATIGTPALVTTTVRDILGIQPRSFRQWVTDNQAAFTLR